jgi:sugar phosphate isomerase/epimerase
VCLALENHDRIPARHLARIVEHIGSPNVGICLDTVNSFGALEGPEVVIEALTPWTVDLHLKEFTVRRFPHKMGFTVEGRPLGQGRLDVPWLLAKLEEQDRDPNAILEQWTPPADTLKATIAREAAWVAESVAFARRFIPD